MGWSIGNDHKHGDRDIGYGVPAVCDHPDCNEKIDRSLAYVCGNEPHGGDHGCGLYFCTKHHQGAIYAEDDPDEEGDCVAQSLCERCTAGQDEFKPKLDTQEWIDWKMTDDSWAEWRALHPEFVVLHSKPITPEKSLEKNSPT